MEKFLSRKFLLALGSIIVGVLTIFNIDDSLINLISAVLLIIIPTLTYLGVEGKIDIERIFNDGIEINKEYEKWKALSTMLENEEFDIELLEDEDENEDDDILTEEEIVTEEEVVV